MSSEPQLFRVNPESRESERVEEVEFSQLGLRERRDIQEWVAANPGILGKDLLIVGKEFSDFDRTNERLDLLAVDSDGKLVIIELKRDDSGADAHWQAIKYASYFRRASPDEIFNKIVAGYMATYEGISAEEAKARLVQHLGADDYNSLNNDQRIILASHRFAPEVTNAVLWLNEKAPGKNLITCVKLTPYRDSNNNSLYIQAATIIPVPGEESYTIGVGDTSQDSEGRGGSTLATTMGATIERNANDEVTQFLRKVGQLTQKELPDDIRPDRTSRWAGAGSWGNEGGKVRYYHLWYSRPPWSNWGMSYWVDLHLQGDANSWLARVSFKYQSRPEMKERLAGLNLDAQQESKPDYYLIEVPVGSGTLNDDFADRITGKTRKLIKQITPIVNDLENESNEEGA